MRSPSQARFERYVGIDYSGAETPSSSLPGLRVFVANRATTAVELPPPPSPRKYWTRKGVAEWLARELEGNCPTIVGIDHGFSFPLSYFERHRLNPDWTEFLEDFQRHWPTDGDRTCVDFIREGLLGNGAARGGERTWRRLTELRAGSAKSVFHFDVQGQVAKSTHAGLPWLLFLRRHLKGHVHFWPFDGWEIPIGKSAIVEVYPSLWRQEFAAEGMSDDQRDAFAVAEWLRRADLNGELSGYLKPALQPTEHQLAKIEGWILGSERVERTTSGSSRAIRRKATDSTGITIRVDMAAPAKNTALSMFNEAHPDYAKVVALQEAARKALDGISPYSGIPLRLVLHVGRALCRADGLNLINGIADVLQRRPNLSYDKSVWLFDDDVNIKEFRYTESKAESDWYELTIAPIEQPKQRRIS